MNRHERKAVKARRRWKAYKKQHNYNRNIPKHLRIPSGVVTAATAKEYKQNYGIYLQITESNYTV